MYTSLVLVALVAPVESTKAVAEAPTWQQSYGVACKIGKQQDKPLAVFIGNGPTGWKQVVEGGKLSEQTRKVLAEGYVCVYVDRATPGGSRLAEQFDVPSGPGLVVSTRDGKGQAFFHAGKLAAAQLQARLSKYAGEPVVTHTEMLVEPRTSFAYNPTSNSPASTGYSPPPAMNYNPGFTGGYSSGFGGFNGGGFGGGGFGGGFSGGGGGGGGGC